LHRPRRTKQIVIYDPYEMVDLFGQNFDLKYMGFDKAEMHSLLQQRSFRGLYLRLQFWVNLLLKYLYGPKKNPDEVETYLNKYTLDKVTKIICFILYMRETVLDVYEKSTDIVPEFEWNKHVKVVLDADNKHCIVECGGWAGYHGNEYLGNSARLFITPVTERYFVYMSSALREKSAVAFRTIPAQDSCGNIVEEFANLCTIPLQKFHISSTFNFNLLLAYVSASAFGSTWVLLEHLNNLPFELMTVLNKEIQIVQQKVILADLNRASEVYPIVKLNLEGMKDSVEKKRISYGLFCSILNDPNKHELLEKQEETMKSSFRITSLVLPDFEVIVKHLFYAQGFVSFIILSEKVKLFKETIESKVASYESTFLTEDPTRIKNFHFKIDEFLYLIDKMVAERDIIKQDYERFKSEQPQVDHESIHTGERDSISPPLSVRKSILSISRANPLDSFRAREKNATDQKDLKKIKEELMNTRKFNTEEDMDEFERVLTASVLAEFTFNK